MASPSMFFPVTNSSRSLGRVALSQGSIFRTPRQNTVYIGHFHTAISPGRDELGETQDL